MELKIKQSNSQELKKYIHVSQIAGNLEADLLNEKQAGTLDGRIFEFYPGPLFYSGIFDTKGFELIIFKEEENYSVWDIIVPANTPAEKILRLNVNILNRLDREERDTHAAVIITGNKIVTYDNNDNRNKILLNLKHASLVNHVIIQEDIRFGESIRKYQLEGLVDKKWVVLSTGESIGQKRIEHFENVKVNKLRLKV